MRKSPTFEEKLARLNELRKRAASPAARPRPLSLRPNERALFAGDLRRFGGEQAV